MRWSWAVVAASVVALAEPPTVVVEVTGLRSAAGEVRCLLFASSDGFPRDPAKALRRATAKISGGTALCEFTSVPAGSYAASAHHDENGNGKVDTGLFGIPKEGVAYSNDARSSLGPPGFDAARVQVPAAGAKLKVRALYY